MSSIALPAKLRFTEAAPVSDRTALAGSGGVLAALVAMFALMYQVLPRLFSPEICLFVAQPLLWVGVAVLSFTFWRRLASRQAPSKVLIGLSAVAGVFNVSA